tara:strand:- start:3205 stop:3717 length:513 start_codon:yes stop_codon:yes gene_type:complete
MRILLPLICLLLASCDHGIYTRGGVTDGDSFYLAPGAFSNEDPAYQSWVTYSLIKSACQLTLGGENPARASSFECEFRSRQHLANAWEEKLHINPLFSDDYLDQLAAVQNAGYLAEYTVYFHGRKGWTTPPGLRSKSFQRWRQEHLRGHRPMTRITGSWNYRKKVMRPPT